MTLQQNLSLTQRELTRREIADQVESFLRQGGAIEVLSGPGCGATPVGPVWWEVAGSLRGDGVVGSRSF